MITWQPKGSVVTCQCTKQRQHYVETKKHLRLQLTAKTPQYSLPLHLVGFLLSNDAALPGLQHKGCLS